MMLSRLYVLLLIGGCSINHTVRFYYFFFTKILIVYIKNSAAINNHYLDCIQTRGLVSLANDNHVDTNLKQSTQTGVNVWS